MADIEATFTLEPQPEIEADFNIDVQGITEHNLLINRDLPNQHPMSAITGLSGALSGKQDTLVAGINIQINGDVISATDTTYVAGQGISIVGNVISNTQTSAEWGNITGTLSNQTDLRNALNGKQNVISDLSTIRTNATKGASAYTTIQGYGNIVTHNVSEFATSAQGTLADSALQPNDNISELVNNAGYITSSALEPYVLSSSLATVATTGNYNDLTNKPTIPTVNNPTITFTQGGTTKGTFTLNQSSNETIALDAGGSAPTNMVTTDTAQDITGIKTFIGEKRIKFKQSSTADRLGFTLYTKSNAELGAFEYRPNTINGGAFININTSIGNNTYVGFRYWNSVNIIAPKPSSGDYFITIGVTDGTNTVYTQTDTGVINISTLLPTVPTNVSAFTNDAGYITSSALTGYATESYVTTATANMQTTANLVTSISSASTDSQYPSAKCVYDIVGDIETLLSQV